MDLLDLLDMSIMSGKGNRYVLVMVDCFSRWREACPLPDKTAISVADAFFSNIVCRFGMPGVIHSDQGRLSHFAPADITSLRRRWPKAVFNTLRRRASDVEKPRKERTRRFVTVDRVFVASVIPENTRP